jgi:phage terminase small subunit
MPNWDEIKKEFESSKITLAALAEKYGVKLGTLKSRKSREGWSRGSPKKDATKTDKVATLNKKDASDQKPNKAKKEPVVESDELTDKQRFFCIYYVKSFNATQAAIKAGYSPDTAHVQGPRLLGNVRVAEEIKRIKTEMQQGVFIDAMDVLNKWIKIAFADITDYATFGKREEPVIGMYGPVMDEEGKQVMQEVNYVDFKESTMIDGTIVTEVKQGKDGISLKLADKLKALEKLSQYFDLFPDKFKRQIEEEKLRIAHHKVFGSEDPEEFEDDGFEDALNATTSEVWADVGDSTEEDS